jgi:hypothetical protein
LHRDPISAFVDRHPTVKMLALSFLVLIGTNLVAEGIGQHIPKGYTYFAMAFSVLVEMLNIRVRKAEGGQRKEADGGLVPQASFLTPEASGLAITVVDAMWPVTFASVLNMSGIVSTAIRRPTPSGGRPSDTSTGASMKRLALGMPGTLKLISTAVISTHTSAVNPTATP